MRYFIHVLMPLGFFIFGFMRLLICDDWPRFAAYASASMLMLGTSIVAKLYGLT